jgi:hypothetical protein
MRVFCFMWLTENICHKMALKSGNGRSSGKCLLTSNGHHKHSRQCCHHLVSFCDVSKKCYYCSRLGARTENRQFSVLIHCFIYTVLSLLLSIKVAKKLKSSSSKGHGASITSERAVKTGNAQYWNTAVINTVLPWTHIWP